MSETGRYNVSNLMPALRLFVEARNRAVASGFTDNGGAIHSIERILDILCQRVVYPHLRHIKRIKTDPAAEISVEAARARERGERLHIEHVMPQRAFALQVIGMIDDGASDGDLLEHIKMHYRLVVLTEAEARALDRKNRSRIAADRIKDAGIVLWTPEPASRVEEVE